MSTDYTTWQIWRWWQIVDDHTQKANQARLHLDFATEPNDIAHWELVIVYETQQADRWRADVVRLEAEHAEAT